MTALEENGFEIVLSVVSDDDVRRLREQLVSNGAAGVRGLLAHPLVREIALRLASLMSEKLGAPSKAVRAIFFDKTLETNWLVPWHQDLTITVAEKHDMSGFGPWSVKDGAHHVQPPVSVLEQMLTIRLHLDDCDETNGALQVLPGSHRDGRIDAVTIQQARKRVELFVCGARAGDALLMRPMLLHASSRSSGSAHRRVLHIEYAACELPPPLRWSEMLR